MSCILRISGSGFDVDRLLEECPFEPVNVWYAGQPRFKNKPDGKKNKTSGLGIEISDADFSELSAQIRDAIDFCITNREFLIRLTAFPGIEDVVADFGAEVREPFWHSYNFPSEMLRVFGEFGISLGLSVYPVYEESEDEAVDQSN